jgi:hypothetical protein
LASTASIKYIEGWASNPVITDSLVIAHFIPATARNETSICSQIPADADGLARTDRHPSFRFDSSDYVIEFFQCKAKILARL